jgi:prepilin-type N-terminal cleavage/methylation domain-containing protein
MSTRNGFTSLVLGASRRERGIFCREQRKFMRRRTSGLTGFTLIELLVVIAIIALLSAMSNNGDALPSQYYITAGSSMISFFVREHVSSESVIRYVLSRRGFVRIMDYVRAVMV